LNFSEYPYKLVGYSNPDKYLKFLKNYVFQEEKNADGPVAHLRLSGQDRSDRAVGSAQGAGCL
jgi:hypothetical protein